MPHFEKMLYDNALLIRVYAHLWRATGSDLARRVALETADFLIGELATPEGGFASALDADSDDGTGTSRRGRLLRLDARAARRRTRRGGRRVRRHVLRRDTEQGTFEEGASVLQLPQGNGVVDADRIAAVRERLLAARARRPRPGRDDKVVAAWNGLAIAALAETGAYFDRPDLVQAAVDAADLLVRVHLDEHGRLLRTSRDGAAGANAGVLEDYGDVAEGFLALASVTGEGVWLDFAGLLLDCVLRHFVAEDGSLYDTADDAEVLIRRPQDPTDNAVPSGWTAAAGALLSYAAHTGSDPHRVAAERALGVVGALAARAPRFIGWGLAVAEAALDGPREVAVVGPIGDPLTAELHRTALLGGAPGVVVAVGEEGSHGVPAAAAAADAGRAGRGLRVPRLRLRRADLRPAHAAVATAAGLVAPAAAAGDRRPQDCATLEAARSRRTAGGHRGRSARSVLGEALEGQALAEQAERAVEDDEQVLGAAVLHPVHRGLVQGAEHRGGEHPHLQGVGGAAGALGDDAAEQPAGGRHALVGAGPDRGHVPDQFLALDHLRLHRRVVQHLADDLVHDERARTPAAVRRPAGSAARRPSRRRTRR